jgi:hypothetical protein
MECVLRCLSVTSEEFGRRVDEGYSATHLSCSLAVLHLNSISITTMAPKPDDSEASRKIEMSKTLVRCLREMSSEAIQLAEMKNDKEKLDRLVCSVVRAARDDQNFLEFQRALGVRHLGERAQKLAPKIAALASYLAGPVAFIDSRTGGPYASMAYQTLTALLMVCRTSTFVVSVVHGLLRYC